MAFARVVQELNSCSLGMSEIPYKKCQNPYTNSKKGHFSPLVQKWITSASEQETDGRVPLRWAFHQKSVVKFTVIEGRQPFNGPTSQASCIPKNCHSCQHIFSSTEHEEAVTSSSDANYRNKCPTWDLCSLLSAFIASLFLSPSILDTFRSS